MVYRLYMHKSVGAIPEKFPFHSLIKFSLLPHFHFLHFQVKNTSMYMYGYKIFLSIALSSFF